jgi:hypothetical protein
MIGVSPREIRKLTLPQFQALFEGAAAAKGVNVHGDRDGPTADDLNRAIVDEREGRL